MNNIFSYASLKSRQNTLIIAEPSGNHSGNIQKLYKLMLEVKKTNADAIKIQLYDPESITINSIKKDFLIKKSNTWSSFKNLYMLYKKARTPIAWADDIFSYAKKINLPIFSSVFDFKALNKLENLGCCAYKIASNEITDIPLIKKTLSTNKTVFISTGMCTNKDIHTIYKHTPKKFHKNIIWMNCTSSYPTPYNEVNLNQINFFRKFSNIIGLSDHTEGYHVPISAVTLGYRVIEKHIKLNNKTVDGFFSLYPREFSSMVKSIREVEDAIGLKNKIFITKSSTINSKGRRSLYVVNDIKKGDFFNYCNIRSIRPGYGLHPLYLNKILNKKSNTNLKKGTRMKLKYVEGF